MPEDCRHSGEEERDEVKAMHYMEFNPFFLSAQILTTEDALHFKVHLALLVFLFKKKKI